MPDSPAAPRRCSSPLRPGLAIQASTRAAALLLLAASSCQPSSEAPDPAAGLALVDFVPHQRLNLTTDSISLPRGRGLEHLGYGWRLAVNRAKPEESHAAIHQEVGRLHLFSADGDWTAIELELGLMGASAGESAWLSVRLNGRRLQRLRLLPGWTSLRLEVPSDRVRVGANLLELAPRTRGARRRREVLPAVGLRRLRLVSASGRGDWQQRPSVVRGVVDGAEEASPQIVEMPTASFLDMVFRMPADARLVGDLEVRMAEDDDPRPVEVYARLLDQLGREHSLVDERLSGSSRRRLGLDVPLSGWEGELVRLRLGISGPRNALLRGHGVRLASPGPVTMGAPVRPIDLQPPPRSGRLARPDVLVILLDAARADAFSPFGGPHETPASERLARDGTRFADALSPSPWTGQSVPAIFTGLYPDTLRVGAWGSRIPEPVPTLAQLLEAGGYRTVLWSQHPFYRQHVSFRRGFQEFYRAPRGAYGTLPEAGQLTADGRPTFAFVHLIPPHAPYRPPPPFLGAFTSWYRGDMPVTAAFLNGLSRPDRRGAVSEDDLRYARDRYLENAAFADHLVGRILDLLVRAGRYDPSLIVLLSDHGEAFFEHGRFLHTRSVHREFLHVPLIVKWPKATSGFRRQVDAPVSLVDLAPTLVDGLALAGVQQGLQGRSWLPLVFDYKTPARRRYAVTRGVADRRKSPAPEIMFEAAGWRILYDPLTDSSKLYRADRDPLETADLAAAEPLRALLLRQGAQIQASFNRDLLTPSADARPPIELDTELVEQLQALGYLEQP